VWIYGGNRMSYQHDYYLKNKEQIDKKHREYYHKNKEKRTKKIHTYQKKNRNYLNQKKTEYNLAHKKETKIRNKKYHRERKKLLHELKINGCSICGYNTYDSCLEFHHVNPKDKSFSLKAETMSHPPDKIVNEIHKCILLCKNCHFEIHAEERGEKRNEK